MLKKLAGLLASAFLLTASLAAGQTASLKDNPPFFPADPSASPKIAALRQAVASHDSHALDTFWSEIRVQGAPLVESLPAEPVYSFVTFVFRGTASTQNVVITDGVAVAVGGIDPRASEMIHLDGTDVWYRTYKVRNDARFVYKISENDPLESVAANRGSIVDPLNPHVFGTNQSFVELPLAPPQAEILRASDSPGKMETLKFRSPSLGNERDVWVYTPHDFNPAGGPYPLLLAFDGAGHVSTVPTILDNLISRGQIPPTVAVLIGSLNRDAELSCAPPFASFVSDELVPWMRKTYRATSDPSMTVIAGSSLGGLAASFTAFRHSDVIGKVLSQSGSYWWAPDDATRGEWLTTEFQHADRLPLEFFLEVGQMEVPEERGTNEHLRDVLQGRGYVVHFQEFNGNHTQLDWRGTFGEGLTSLIGTAGRPSR